MCIIEYVYLRILCDYSCAMWNDGYVVHQPFLPLVFGASCDTSETEHAISIKNMGEKMKTHTNSLSKCYTSYRFGHFVFKFWFGVSCSKLIRNI